ncbi:MAG: nuclear transport factor 2 family protein [Treponema sp.]|nr:nuclear transport factor 2 family protein [Treponema sp.]MBQ7539095.1 nuclear transport factor 2 family protein [Treponema sp.]
MKKSFAVYMIMLFAILACIAESPKEKPMTTEEKEVYSAYEGASPSDASRVSASQKLADEEQNVYASYVAINTAMIEKDQAAMERYFDKNLTFTHMNGKKQTRDEFIGEIMDGTLNYFKVDTKDYSINVDGDTAHMKVTIHSRQKFMESAAAGL